MILVAMSDDLCAFSALTLLTGWQEWHSAHKILLNS